MALYLMKYLKNLPKTCTIGKGKYKSSTNKRLYQTWKHMLHRCYDKKIIAKQPTYKDCTVDLHWYNFQNFAEDIFWINSNYEIDTNLTLDKDIKCFENKVYSKDNCLVVPYEINSLFFVPKANARKLPLGISQITNSYRAHCSNSHNQQIRKCFPNLNDAINFYWVEKFKTVQSYMERYPNLAEHINSYYILFKDKYSEIPR